MTDRQTRRSSRIGTKSASVQLVEPLVINKTRFRTKAAIVESDSEADENIENVNMNQTKSKRSTTLAERKTTASKRKSIKPSIIESSGDDDEEVEKATPPKQSKASTKPAEHKLSPTCLLDKLSLASPPPVRSKYQSARKTLNSAETYNLPGREKELAELSEFLSTGMKNQRSSSMYISGPPGTGKTASLSKLLNASEFSNQFKRVYVNCTSISSIGSIYKKVCTELKIKTGTEKECLVNIERYLATKHKTILMVLDEVDQLVGKKQSVLYTIFEWPAKEYSNLLLIGIANSLDLTDRCLSRLHAKCELKPHLMHFAPYSKDQIIHIFKARLDEAGVLDIFPPVTIQLLAAKVASISGDVRRALDIGRRVIEMAEEQKRSKKAIDLTELGIGELHPTMAQANPPPTDKVEIKQVMQVLNQVYGASQTFGDDLEDTFPLQQKILICTILLILKRDKNKDINVGRLHTVYAKVCGSRNIAALGRSEFAGLCDLVETRGIVRIIRNKEPRLCKVQLQWDEQEVTSAVQDKQLIASILADTTCVSSK